MLKRLILCYIVFTTLSNMETEGEKKTVAYQAPLSVGFSRHECWSGLACPSPGDLPNPGIEPRSPTLQAEMNNKCLLKES